MARGTKILIESFMKSFAKRDIEPVNRRHSLDINQTAYPDLESQYKEKISNYISEYLLVLEPTKSSYISALLLWIQNFGFRLDHEIDIPDNEITYQNTEADSIKYLKIFRDKKLHTFFDKGKKDQNYKKAKNFINNMMKMYIMRLMVLLNYL